MRVGASYRASYGAGAVRRAALGALVVVALTSASILSAVPASAADSPNVIDLSSNGTVWSTSLAGGLFDSFQGAVPGESVTKSFYVRNPRAVSVTMKTLALDVTSSSSDFASSITVDGEVGGRTLPAPVSLSALSDCATLAPNVVLAANATVKVSITLAMLDVSGAVAQSSQGGFNVLLTMQDNAAGTPPASCGGDVPGGGGGHHHPKPGGTPGTANPATTSVGNPLAFTGVEIGGSLVFGAVLLGIGLLFLLARRRRRQEKDS